MHKTRMFLVCLICAFVVFGGTAFAAQVHLAWDPSSGEVDGYRIYYGTAQGNYPHMVDVGNVTDYVLTGLEEGVTYYFVARAYNQYGESGNSNEVSWNSGGVDTTPPADVKNFTATPGDGQVILSWTNPTDSDFAGVMIRVRTDTWPANINDGDLVCNKAGSPGGADSFVHTGLQNGTTYYYSAFTYDTSGNYSHTAHAVATPGGEPTNQPPTASITASPTSGESPLEVSFSGSGSDADGNIVSYSWNFGDGHTSSSQNPTHTYARVSSDTQYTVTLTVTDNDGATGQATTTITVNPDSTPPSPPQGISVQ